MFRLLLKADSCIPLYFFSPTRALGGQECPKKYHKNLIVIFLIKQEKIEASVKKTFNLTRPFVKQVGGPDNSSYSWAMNILSTGGRWLKRHKERSRKLLMRFARFHWWHCPTFMFLHLQVAREFVKNERLFNKPELSFGYFVVYTPVRYYQWLL